MDELDLGGVFPQSFNYNADGTLNYVEVTVGVNTWRQTYTYANGKMASVSDWVKQ